MRDHSHEQTPLLGANGVANEASLAKESSPYQQQERSEERAHDELEHPDNEEERDRAGLTRENENTANPETSVGIVGVISVLLLGSWVFFSHQDGWRYLLSRRVLFTKSKTQRSWMRMSNLW